ncbi:MAG: hypothetical protein GY940_39680 [bacterium]|nr:hypothetical protein [bacterium]
MTGNLFLPLLLIPERKKSDNENQSDANISLRAGIYSIINSHKQTYYYICYPAKSFDDFISNGVPPVDNIYKPGKNDHQTTGKKPHGFPIEGFKPHRGGGRMNDTKRYKKINRDFINQFHVGSWFLKSSVA